MSAPTVRFSLGEDFVLGGGQQPWLVPYPDERRGAVARARILPALDLRALETRAWDRWFAFVDDLPHPRVRRASVSPPGSKQACGVADLVTCLRDLEAAKRVALEDYVERHVAEPSRRMR